MPITQVYTVCSEIVMAHFVLHDVDIIPDAILRLSTFRNGMLDYWPIIQIGLLAHHSIWAIDGCLLPLTGVEIWLIHQLKHGLTD